MIDTLLRFDTRSAALDALAPSGLARDGELDASRAFWCVVTVGGAAQPGEYLWASVLTQAEADALWSLPNDAARLQGQREASVITRSRVDAATMAAARIEPVFAGSAYPFTA